jgi:hypothetical protein
MLAGVQPLSTKPFHDSKSKNVGTRIECAHVSNAGKRLGIVSVSHTTTVAVPARAQKGFWCDHSGVGCFSCEWVGGYADAWNGLLSP